MVFWRTYGRLANSRVGRFLLEHDGGLVSGAASQAMSVGMAVDLEETVPWTPLSKPVRECRVALVTTAGVHLDDQPPFDVDAALGDAGFRIIADDVEPSQLQISHTHYPTDRATRDINVIFPLQRLHEAATEGGIAGCAPRHVAFGFCALTRELVAAPDGTAHRAAEILREDGVDLALLVPG